MNKKNQGAPVKRLICGIFLLLAGFPVSLFGQVVITSDDFLGLIGSSAQVSIDESSMLAVDVGNTGANQVWDFTGLSPNEQITDRSFLSPSGTPFADSFPNANITIHLRGFEAEGGELYQYFRIESDAIFTVGAGIVSTDPDTTFIIEEQVERVAPMPLLMGSEFMDQVERDTLGDISVAGTIEIDSTRSVVDAWGVVHVAAGSFDVIRVRADEFRRTENYVGGQLMSASQSQSFNYEWISPTHFIVVSINSLENEQNPNFTVAGSVEILSAVTTATEYVPVSSTGQSNLGVYPNPFSDFVSLKFAGSPGSVSIEIIDLLGRQVRKIYSGRMESPSILVWNGRDRAGLQQPNGLYFVRFISSGRTEIKSVTLLR